MKVTVLNRKEFEALLISKYDRTLPIEKDLNNCYISIHNYDQAMIEDNYNNYLNLWFDDIDGDTEYNAKYNPNCKAFTAEQAKSIIDFCEQNRGKQNLFVHCFAGIARSGAVGAFVNDVWGEENYEDFHARHSWLCPNSFVSMMLMRSYREYLVNIGCVK